MRPSTLLPSIALLALTASASSSPSAASTPTPTAASASPPAAASPHPTNFPTLQELKRRSVASALALNKRQTSCPSSYVNCNNGYCCPAGNTCIIGGYCYDPS